MAQLNSGAQITILLYSMRVKDSGHRRGQRHQELRDGAEAVGWGLGRLLGVDAH